MADMCETEMRVYGKRRDLEKFITKMEYSYVNEVISFNKIIPIPEDLSIYEEDYSDWYYWSKKHWGTQHDACNYKLTDNGDHLFYFFCTAWKPPLPVYETLINDYQSLNFDIIAIEKYLNQCVDISSKQGQIIKYITWWDIWVPWFNNERKYFSLKADSVNGSLQIVKNDSHSLKEH